MKALFPRNDYRISWRRRKAFENRLDCMLQQHVAVTNQIWQPVGHCLCDHVAVTWQTPYLAEKETGLLFASSLWNLVGNLVMILQWQLELWIDAMQIGALILWYCSGCRLWRTQSSGWGMFVNVKAEQTNPLANNTGLWKLQRSCTFKISFESNHS